MNWNKIFGGAENDKPVALLYAADVFTMTEIQTLYKEFVSKFKPILKIDDRDIRRFVGSHAKNIQGVNIAIIVQDELEFDNLVTDYFVEKVRIQCNNINFASPYNLFYNKRDMWTPYYDAYIRDLEKNAQQNKYSIKQHIKNILKTPQQKQYYALRSALKQALRWHDCANFNYSTCVSIYKLFGSTRVLDMCAGWGERLTSAIMSNCIGYVGVDPNKALAPLYKQLADEFADQPNNYRVITSAFEDLESHPDFNNLGKFDMMFSSPPYFAAEAYSNDAEQSSIRYKTMDDWVTKFMNKSVDIAWDLLVPGAFYCLVLNDTVIDNQDRNFTDLVLHHLDTKPNAKYLGMLKYVHGFICQPIWVYCKMPTDNVPRMPSDVLYVEQEHGPDRVTFAKKIMLEGNRATFKLDARGMGNQERLHCQLFGAVIIK